MTDDENIRLLEPGELRRSLAEKDKLFAEISNLIAVADVDDDVPPAVLADDYNCIASQVCSLQAGFEDPACSSRLASGVEQADGPTAAFGDDAHLNAALQLNQERINICSALGPLDQHDWDDYLSVPRSRGDDSDRGVERSMRARLAVRYRLKTCPSCGKPKYRMLRGR